MHDKSLNYLFKSLATTILLVISCSCQNDGHIGWIFGVWRVESYTVDGEDVMNDKAANTTFSFQNNIVEVVALGPVAGDAETCWGTWDETADRLILNFGHSDDANPPGTGIYSAPLWLGMTSDAPVDMLLRRSSRRMYLSWTDIHGRSISYELKKTW